MNSEFYTSNRKRLADALSGGVVVLSAYTKFQQASDVAHPFHQEPNFWYLSGIEEPDWWLIIDGLRSRSWLVAPERSETSQVFDGGLSTEAILETSGVDEVIDRASAKKLLEKLSGMHGLVYTLGDEPQAGHYDFILNPTIKEMWRYLKPVFTQVQDCRPKLTQLRAIKQPAEVKAIRQAIKLTSEAFEIVKKQIDDYQYEYQIEAEFSYHFRRHGAKGHAYSPIVAFGENATTLHYSTNSSRLGKNGLVLLDIGARLNGYSADLTRTYQRGAPTDRQRQVHAAVQKVLATSIKRLKPGLKVADYLEATDLLMRQALVNLKLMADEKDDVAFRKYFPHAISHGLGVDVHDALGQPEEFLPGMVLTVEPGIYIREEKIGVRLEDNILITEKGHVNLSQSLSTEL